MAGSPACKPSTRRSSRAVKLIVGVPRSGTSALHALACTDPSTNVYVGEASYLRLMLVPYIQGMNVFDKHTRYAFADRGAFQEFHCSLVAQVLDEYATHLGNPEVLVLKDPLLAQHLRELKVLTKDVEIITILRHPTDVISSWSIAREKLGYPRDIAELISKHNATLNHLLTHWDPAQCRLVTYDMLGDESLSQVKAALGLMQIAPQDLWKRADKIYPQDGDARWLTELHGGPLRVNTTTRNKLSDAELAEVRTRCLQTCRNLLRKAGLPVTSYWA